MQTSYRIAIELKPSRLVEILGARTMGTLPETVSGLTTDSRQVQKHDLFIALKGAKENGHEFIPQAIKNGASLVLAMEPQKREPFLLVPDTLFALGEIARHWRNQFSISVSAISGSNGKTTTKEIAASILKQVGTPLVTWLNFNNLIGLPLTLLNLEPSHSHALLEMGMNNFGEIKRLCEIADPDVGLLTNIAPAHLEKLGGIEGVMKAKGELFDCLGSTGTAVINTDNVHTLKLSKDLKCRKITYSWSSKADVQVINCKEKGLDGFDLKIDYSGVPIETSLNIPGRHNVTNALAAAALSLAQSIPASVVGRGIRKVHAAPNRSQIVRLGEDVIVINDCYNANPQSMRIALEWASSLREKGLICVLGDMAELGRESENMHEEILGLLRTLNCKRVYLCGATFTKVVGREDYPHGWFSSLDGDDLIEKMANETDPGDLVLIKGSRSMQMERFFEGLKQRFGNLEEV
jgi:UDP-N-acetylmuramoyl-tripeptide--D-alanyl-D-alanine ligase